MKKIICFLEKEKVTNLKKGIKRKILLDVLICSKRREIIHASSNHSSGIFFPTTSEYILETLLFIVLQTFSVLFLFILLKILT